MYLLYYYSEWTWLKNKEKIIGMLLLKELYNLCKMLGKKDIIYKSTDISYEITDFCIYLWERVRTVMLELDKD